MVTAEQLRAARAILQMDQADLAKISGVSVETIKRLERQTGKLHAKPETIIAIKKAFEAEHLEFLGDHDGNGAGVCLAHPDKLKFLREALIGEWGHMIDQWLKAQCASDPKFFEHGEEYLAHELTKLSTNVLPPILRGVLSGPLKRWPDVVVVTHPDADHCETAALLISASERALADAKHVTPTMLDLIDDATNLSAATNRSFTSAFVAAIPASERGTLIDAQGALSAKGLIRAKNAILAKAYGHADILAPIAESVDNETKSISNALAIAAPQWAQMRAGIEAGRVPADVDATDDLIAAVKRTADMRVKGQKLGDYLSQIDAFDPLTMPVEFWMHIFYDPTSKRALSSRPIAEGIRYYAEQAAKVSAKMGIQPSSKLGPKASVISNVLARNFDRARSRRFLHSRRSVPSPKRVRE
jgi:transcriptional regulator with XRE-family HTH domain